jgi:cholesterol oxidase
MYWWLLSMLVTVYPVGGFRIGGVAASAGVVDHRGEIFGYSGAARDRQRSVARAVGRNPPLTIAKRAAHLMLGEDCNAK